MAEAKDCKHAVALKASRQAIVAVMESLDTKVTATTVFDAIRQVDGFYKICLEEMALEIDSGFMCPSCSIEVLGPDYSFEVWTKNVTTQAIEWAVEIMQESA
jgi:hypothetical protein